MTCTLHAMTDDGLLLAAIEVRPRPRQSDQDAERELHAKLREQFPGRRIFYERGTSAAAPSAPPATKRMTTISLYPHTVEWKR